ncbi:phosphatase PAP2 family protein [uncultured Kriegella sp.]|uniref:phosphatase PAP2 family protein n=1 Tax=uncultured Kriegella sp. TaxID=1798910 RepID=UPI0030D766AE|tara:strand:+ start:28597 stop:29325 length:729 start_codon:yes stop_codon:yes gene_type:complete
MRETLKAFIKKIRAVLAPVLKRYSQYLPYIITVTIALILVVGGINLFIELTDTLKTETLAVYDAQITDYIISHRSPALTRYFLFVTHVGDFYGYLIVVGISAFVSSVVFKRWKYVAQVTLVLILATVSNMMLKRFIDRARPGIEHLVSVETLSYPSGHAMSAMAFYGFMIFLFYKFKMNKFLKLCVILFLVTLILSIGISRIYLGVHFPSDIAGGFIAGFIWVIFCILVFDLIEVFRKDIKT